MRSAAMAFILSTLVVACTEEQYVGGAAGYSVALTEDTPPYVVTRLSALYIVESRIEFPIEPPDEDRWEEQARERARLEHPFPNIPWVLRGDYETRIDWALSNLSDQQVTVDVIVNGFNEFHEYVPGYILDNDEIIPEFAQYERRVSVPPQARLTGTIREEHLDEITVDLATVVNGAPNANQVVHPSSQSARDPRVRDYIPQVIPALTGVRLGLRSDAAVPLLLEASVRMRDLEDKVASPSDDPWTPLPVPMPFMPSGMQP